MNNTFKRLSVFCILLPFIAQAGTVNKSPVDPREYETFTLKNGIEVITVSDPNLATSAATISVGVGQFQDPQNAQGIAHFLEHMIFMGSEKYQSPNEYMQFISENGGQTNAYTAAEQTTYLFSINSDKFPDALDRLSSAIKAPLFNADMVEKEINAVIRVLERSRHWSIGFGPNPIEVKKFESDFAKYCGVKHAIAVSNNGDGFDMVLNSLNLKPNDEIIAPALNFKAWHMVLLRHKCKCVFVDIDPKIKIDDIKPIDDNAKGKLIKGPLFASVIV